mmetsp:Transcript_9046/g.21520  ORF Transcript_9046/g.21520 Transcript_9046/m.21520 type:complete len:218 (-) Transcript_9046:535-1188(-)
MNDIYLTYDQPNYAFAQRLKHDVELFTGLSVALESEDDEDTDDCHLKEQLYQASTLLILATQHSSVAAWVMDDGNSKEDTDNENDRQSICFPASIDFSRNYQHGVSVFLNMVAKQRKLSLRRRAREETKEEEDFVRSRVVMRPSFNEIPEMINPNSFDLLATNVQDFIVSWLGEYFKSHENEYRTHKRKDEKVGSTGTGSCLRIAKTFVKAQRSMIM